jgi:hypothetical protein
LCTLRTFSERNHQGESVVALVNVPVGSKASNCPPGLDLHAGGERGLCCRPCWRPCRRPCWRRTVQDSAGQCRPVPAAGSVQNSAKQVCPSDWAAPQPSGHEHGAAQVRQLVTPLLAACQRPVPTHYDTSYPTLPATCQTSVCAVLGHQRQAHGLHARAQRCGHHQRRPCCRQTPPGSLTGDAAMDA